MQRAAVPELKPAVAAVVQVSAEELLEEIQQTGGHPIDVIGLAQTGDAERAASGTAGGIAQVHGPQPGVKLLGAAMLALKDPQIPKTLEERPVYPVQALTATGTSVLHCLVQL